MVKLDSKQELLRGIDNVRLGLKAIDFIEEQVIERKSQP